MAEAQLNLSVLSSVCISIEALIETLAVDIERTTDESCSVHVNQFRMSRRMKQHFSLHVYIVSNRKLAGFHYRHNDVLLSVSEILTD
jgi:hypothetical protein